MRHNGRYGFQKEITSVTTNTEIPMAERYRTHQRALQTLDFSTTPDGNSWSVRALRTVLLKPILDRMELPPEDEIPGDVEVADGAVATGYFARALRPLRGAQRSPSLGLRSLTVARHPTCPGRE